MCVCLFIYLCVCVYVLVYICAYLYDCIYVWILVCVYVYSFQLNMSLLATEVPLHLVENNLSDRHLSDTLFRQHSLDLVNCPTSFLAKCLSVKCFSAKRLGTKKLLWPWKARPGNPYWRERFSTVDLLVQTSLDQLLLRLKTLFTFLLNKLFNEEVNCTEPPPSVSVPWLG